MYHCLIFVGGLSTSISFLLIAPLISLLNFSIRGLPLYLLSLAALQNSCMYSSIVFSLCSILLNSTAFTTSSSLSLNYFLISVKNSPTVSYSNIPSSRSSNTFSFQTSTDPPCIYNKIHWICSSSGTSLIFILKYNLHTMINPLIFSTSLLRIDGLATSIWNSVLDPSAVLTTTAPPTIRACNCICIAASCFYCCIIIAYKLC